MESVEANNQRTILIVDDEQPIVDILVYNLKKEGYNTLEANDGLTVCKKIRSKYNIPILMLTAKDEEIDKILGLELGADDYITKPFSVRELMARIKANLRKYEIKAEQYNTQKNNSTNKIIVAGDLTLDLDKIKLDGDKLLGFDDQIEALKKSDAYLFEIDNAINNGVENNGVNPRKNEGGNLDDDDLDKLSDEEYFALQEKNNK